MMEERVTTTAGQEAGEHLSPEGEHDDEAAGEKAAGARRPGLRRVEYLILGLAVLLVMVLVGGGVFIWVRSIPAGKGKGHSSVTPRAAVVELETFFVPLKTQDEPEKFLRVQPVLEVTDKASARTITKKMEQVRATVLQILLGALPTELDYPQGNKELIDTMVSSLNRCLKEDMVTGIHFNHAEVL
jgi:flagellar basal body-associated protein FliL